MKGKSVERKYATTNNPTIKALVEGMYHFIKEEDAIDRINLLRSIFVISKESENMPENEFLIWIKGYALSEEDKANRFVGHYGRVFIVETDSALYAVRIEKVWRPLAGHPQKTRVDGDHPSWNHPFLRRIKNDTKGNIYEDLESAQAALAAFNLEFPKTSILNPGKIYCMVWTKYNEDGTPRSKPILKIVISAVQTPDNKYKLVYNVNEKSAAERDAYAKEEAILKSEVTNILNTNRNFDSPGRQKHLEKKIAALLSDDEDE